MAQPTRGTSDVFANLGRLASRTISGWQVVTSIMPHPFLSSDTGGLRLPSASSPSSAVVVAVLWLLFACGVPLYQLREARRQARHDLVHAAAADKRDAAGLIAAFDRANQDLDAAAFSLCLLLAFTTIFLVNQLFRLKRQYHALAHDFSIVRRR